MFDQRSRQTLRDGRRAVEEWRAWSGEVPSEAEQEAEAAEAAEPPMPTTTVLAVLAHSTAVRREQCALAALCFWHIPAAAAAAAATPAAAPSTASGRRVQFCTGASGAAGGAAGGGGGEDGGEDGTNGSTAEDGTLPPGFPTGVALLDALHAALAAGGVRGLPRKQLWRLFASAAAPWLAWLRGALFRGEARDPHHEFTDLTEQTAGRTAGPDGAGGRTGGFTSGPPGVRMPAFVGALGAHVADCVGSHRLLCRSARFVGGEFGWPGNTAPTMRLVRTGRQLRAVVSCWEAQARRQAQQEIRLRASCVLEARRLDVYEARALLARRESIRLLEEVAISPLIEPQLTCPLSSPAPSAHLSPQPTRPLSSPAPCAHLSPHARRLPGRRWRPRRMKR